MLLWKSCSDTFGLLNEKANQKGKIRPLGQQAYQKPPSAAGLKQDPRPWERLYMMIILTN
jgi:hypothetical protein